MCLMVHKRRPPLDTSHEFEIARDNFVIKSAKHGIVYAKRETNTPKINIFPFGQLYSTKNV